MQDLIPDREAWEHLSGSHSKVLLQRQPSWALLARWPQKICQAHMTEALQARPQRSPVPQKKRELSWGNLGSDRFLALTTSWLVLFGSFPAGLYQMGLICKAAWKHQRVTFEKDNCRQPCGGGGAFGASTIAAAWGLVVTHSAHQGPSLWSYLLDCFGVVGKL